MHKNKIKTIYQIKTLLIVLIIFYFFAVLNISFAQSFIGPSCAAGQCQGRIGVDSSGNVSMGTSTPQSGTKTLIISQTSDSSSYGLRVLSSNNSPLFLVRSDGKISIATSGASYALNVSGDIYASGNLVVGGTFSAPMSAGNVTPGVFNSLQGGGTGAYAFLGSLGVATSSQVGLPQTLSVYGGGYFSGNVGIGTTAPAYPLDVVNTVNTGGIRIRGTTDNNALRLESTATGGRNYYIASTGGASGWGQGKLVFVDSNVGSARIVIDSTGNVGIGTTTPAYKLNVVGQINSSGGLCIAGDCKTAWSQVGGSSQWTNTTGGIYYLGNVGIGTSTVSYPLFISTSTDTLFAIRRTGASSPTIFKQGTDSGFVINNEGSDILTIKSGNVGIGTTGPVSKLHVNAGVARGITLDGDYGVNQYSLVLDHRNAHADAFILHNAYYSSGNENLKWITSHGTFGSRGIRFSHTNGITFYANSVTTTANTEFVPTPRMFIGNNGNVGIGTTAPTARLHTVGNVQINRISDASTGRLFINGGGLGYSSLNISPTGERAQIFLGNNVDANGNKFIRVFGGNLEVLNNAYDTNAVLFAITDSGNVGIGTTAPAYKLDVVGQINSSGGLCIAGDCKTSWPTGGGGNFWASSTNNNIYNINTGNVGIGTTAPNAKLHVNGNIRVAHGFGTDILISSYRGTSSYGYNIFIGNGGQFSRGIPISGAPSDYGSYNTSNGYDALYYNEFGRANTASGYQALYSNTAGHYNTANGANALYSNTTGSSSTANGAYALYSNTTGYLNTANGVYALYSNTTGDSNTANGYGVLYSNTTGHSNTANGAYALYSNTTGDANTANGAYALVFNTTGNFNTANGMYALLNNTTGHLNTAIGANALYSNTGNGNVALGYSAGYSLNGSRNIAIGYHANAMPANSNYTLNIGNLIFGIGVDGVNQTLSSGNVGIGTTNPSYKLHVNGSFAANQKNFDIDHPTKPGYRLIHSTLEGPEIAVFYRGEAKLINGEAIVKLPDYFEALTRKENRTVQLTAKGTEPYLLSAGEVSEGKFNVFGTKKDGEFYWEVKAIRADIELLNAEVKK